MTDQQLIERRAHLLAIAAEQHRTAEYLNDTHFAVQSKSHPLMRRVVTIDANSGYATSCSGITFDQEQCPAFAVRGVCTHSALSEAAFAQLAPAPTCDDHVLQDIEDSIDWSRVDTAYGEFPTVEAEREEHLAHAFDRFYSKAENEAYHSAKALEVNGEGPVERGDPNQLLRRGGKRA